MSKGKIAIAAGLAFILSRRGKASAKSGGGVPQMKADFANAWRDRCLHLMQRARSGAVWAPRMAALLGSDAAGAAAGRWIGMESAGNPRNVSPLKERGLAQLAPVSVKDLGFTQAEFDAMIDPKTTDAQHAKFAAKVIWMEIVRSTASAGTIATSPGWGPPIGPVIVAAPGDVKTAPDGKGVMSANGLAFGKIRHALPMLLKELHAQNLIRSSIPNTMRAMMTGGTIAEGNQGIRVERYKPSARVASFAKGSHALTGDPVRDLIIRFLAPVAVIAHAEEAFGVGAGAVS